MRWVLTALLAVAVAAGARVLVTLSADGIPDRFPGLADLPDCGTLDRDVIDGPEEACFEDALEAGSDPELVVVTLTEDGDEVVSYYRTVPGRGGVEIYTDLSEVPTSDETWRHSRCPAAQDLYALGRCTDEVLT